MKRAFVEFRLFIVSMLAVMIVRIAPINTLEGQDIIKALHGYAKRAHERARFRQ